MKKKFDYPVGSGIRRGNIYSVGSDILRDNNRVIPPAINGKLVKTSEAVFELMPIALSDDPIDQALLAIKHHDFLGEIQSSPIFRPLVLQYTKNWVGIILIRNETNKVLLHIQESLLPDRLNRAGFDPGYIKILLFIQEKYRIFQEEASRRV